MEFIRLGRLKNTLREGPLSAVETAKYLAVQGALLSFIFIPSPADMSRDWTMIAYPVSALIGVYYCYRRNGGAGGRHFAERYLAIGWVVGLRIGLSLAMAIGIAAAIAALLGFNFDALSDPVVTHGWDIAAFGAVLFVYWRTGVHLADVPEKVSQDSRRPF
jgi:hypothetical protein